MGNASDSIAREIEAMAAIGRALGDLTDPAARQRVLKWANERFSVEQPAVTAPAMATQPALVAGATLATATDADLAVDSLSDMFAVGIQDVDDDLGEFAAVPAQAQEAQPVEEIQKLPLATLLKSLASDFRAFADEWNGAAA
jgi:hypothetical protein